MSNHGNRVRCARCLVTMIAVLTGIGGMSRAQGLQESDPEPIPHVPDPMTQEESREGAESDPGLWMESLRTLYRTTRTHEVQVVTVRAPDGDSSTARVEMHWWPPVVGGDATVADPGQMLLNLGPLRVLIDGRRVAAVHRHNLRTVFVMSDENSDGGTALDVLRFRLPPIPIPQIVWSLGESVWSGRNWNDCQRFGPWFADIEIDKVTFEMIGIGATATAQLQQGRSRCVVWTDSTGRVTRIVARSPLRGADTNWGEIEIASQPIDPIPRVVWDEFVAGRERVNQISALRAAPSQESIGSRLTNLGLMTSSAEVWDISNEITRRALRPQATRMALLLYVPSSKSATEEAITGRLAIAVADARLRRQTAIDGESALRLYPVVVGVVGVAEFQPEALSAFELQWTKLAAPITSGEAAPHQWTNFGGGLIERFVRGSQSVIVVIDAGQIIRAIVPLDGRRGDADALGAEIAELMQAGSAVP